MAETELFFYTNPMSRGQTVRWMLEEIAHPYLTQILEFGALKEPGYLKINPMGKVPAIRHGEVVVTECPAICAYLADAFPHMGLAPPVESRRRGPYYRWLFFAAGPLEYAVFNRHAKFEPTGDQARMIGYGTVEATLDTLEGAIDLALTGPGYLTGEAFTAADLYVAAFLGFGLQFGMIEKRDAFDRFVGKMQNRPAWVRARAIDQKLTADMQKA